MRQGLFIFILMGLVWLAGYEWSRTGHDFGRLSWLNSFDSTSADRDVSGPSSTRAGRSAPVLTISDARIRNQERVVADLQKAYELKKSAFDELLQKRDNLERSTQPTERVRSSGDYQGEDDLESRISDTRNVLATLQFEKASQLDRLRQTRVSERAAIEERRLNAEIAAAQLRETLTREEALAQNLNQRLQMEVARNLNSDELHALQVEAPAQAQRVAALRAQYQGMQLQYAQASADDEAIRHTDGGASFGLSEFTALDERIRETQFEISSLERAGRDQQRRQLAGTAASNQLDNQALDQRHELESLSVQLEGAKETLLRLKNSAYP